MTKYILRTIAFILLLWSIQAAFYTFSTSPKEIKSSHQVSFPDWFDKEKIVMDAGNFRVNNASIDYFITRARGADAPVVSLNFSGKPKDSYNYNLSSWTLDGETINIVWERNLSLYVFLQTLGLIALISFIVILSN